jgi:nicotinate-nucleotide--dimethylbenzimidazole phosphoribosyltransferase
MNSRGYMEKLKDVIARIEPIEESWFGVAQKDLDSLTKPLGSLGRLEEIARRLVAIRRERKPCLGRKVIFVMAGDHGVVAEGVSAFLQEVTPQMVRNFLNGGAAINVLARHVGADVVIADVGVASDIKPHPSLAVKKIGHGTGNIAREPAMRRDQAVASLEAGIELFESEAQTRGVGIVGTGDMGIGNTTPSSAILSAITGQSPEDVTGRGTGIDYERWRHKVRIIEQALKVNRPDPKDGLDVLMKVGGFEIGAIAGLVLAAASQRVPVVVDGFISTAGALIATTIQPSVSGYLFAAHRSAEAGHKAVLDRMGWRPILDLEMRLGEGTGAVLAMGIIEAAAKILAEMATFEHAGVSGKM